jgi:hypothetical protein
VQGLIDNDKEHNRVLYELGLLDDDDDWKLYCKMVREQEIEIDEETWEKYSSYLK